MQFIKTDGKYINAHIGDKTLYSPKMNNIETNIA